MISIRFLRPAILAGFLVLTSFSPAHATVPTDATGRCNVIHSYEAVCGNLRTNACYSKDGFNYSSNSAHQLAWDNFFNLCVNNGTYQDRYSHECIEFLGLSSSCTSTVEPLVEYTMVHTYEYEVMPFHEPVNLVHTDNVVYLCGLYSESSAKITAYRNACGEVTPSECSVNGTVESEYLTVCGDKKPCQCVNEYHCGPVCEDPPLPPPPLPPVPTPSGEPVGGGPGGGGPGGGPSPTSPEAPGPLGPNGPNTFVLGGENNAPAPVGETEGGAGAAAAGAKGCSLGGTPTGGGEIVFLSLIFGGLGLGLSLRRRRAQ